MWRGSISGNHDGLRAGGRRVPHNQRRYRHQGDQIDDTGRQRIRFQGQAHRDRHNARSGFHHDRAVPAGLPIIVVLHVMAEPDPGVLHALDLHRFPAEGDQEEDLLPSHGHPCDVHDPRGIVVHHELEPGIQSGLRDFHGNWGHRDDSSRILLSQGISVGGTRQGAL